MSQRQHQSARNQFRRYQMSQSEMKSPRLTIIFKLQHLSSLQKIFLVTLLLPTVTMPRSIPPSNSLEFIPAQNSHEDITIRQQQLIGTSEEEGQRSSQEELLRRKRTALFRRDPVLWPNKTIPFVFEEPFPKRYKKQVMNAIGVWQTKTRWCITFVDRTDEEYYARFVISDRGCNSQIGVKKYPKYHNSGQPVNLKINCLKKRGLIMHELGHLIGFHHEHQRPDRDNYLRIQLGNALPVFIDQFQKNNFTTYGEYDFDSIMHYPLNIFTRPNASGNTMAVLANVTVPEGVIVGRQHTLSQGDRKKAKLMYQCPKKKVVKPVEVLSPDNIYTGEQVALRVSGDNFPESSWVSCTDRRCTVNDCIGKNFRQEDTDICPSNIFNLHKVVSGSTRRGSGVVKVGDSIILEGGYPLARRQSSFLFCNENTQVCSLSQVCVTGQRSYNNTAFCREHVLIVRAEGKKTGQAITHRDLIGFEFQSRHDDFFEQQCAFGCNPANKVCLKKLCVFSHSNSLPGVDPTLQTQASPVCGKDMFYIQKY